MKQLISMLLAVLLVLGLSACAGKEAPKEPAASNQNTEPAPVKNDPVPTEWMPKLSTDDSENLQMQGEWYYSEDNTILSFDGVGNFTLMEEETETYGVYAYDGKTLEMIEQNGAYTFYGAIEGGDIVLNDWEGYFYPGGGENGGDDNLQLQGEWFNDETDEVLSFDGDEGFVLYSGNETSYGSYAFDGENLTITFGESHDSYDGGRTDGGNLYLDGWDGEFYPGGGENN